MFYSFESFYEKGIHYFDQKDYSNAKLELEKAYALIGIKQKNLKKEIEEKIEFCASELSNLHMQYGLNYLETGDLKKAVDELNIALNLEIIPAKKKKINTQINKAEKELQKENIWQLVEENYNRAVDFLNEKDLNQAYVEFKEAYNIIKNFSIMKEEIKDIEEKLQEIEHKLVSGYFKKAEKYTKEKKYEQAWEELEFAQAIVDDFDKDDIKEIEKLHTKLKKHVMDEQIKGGKELNEKMLEKAIHDFEDLTDLYFKYGLTENNPYNPKYQNMYEKEYNNARKNLACIYHKIADNFMDEKKVAIAFKFYQDSLELFNEDEIEFTEVSTKLETIRKIKAK